MNSKTQPHILDFEKPIADIQDQIIKLQELGARKKADVSASLKKLEQLLAQTKQQIYSELSPWQRVQLSRHPERPYSLFYFNTIFQKFFELHGDRYFGDDKAMVGGLAYLDDMPVMLIGHQKGKTTKERQFRNFGMANPEGYRKALRLMKTAEKFNIPVITFIDTPGAYPGIEAEERGQAEAIAKNLFEMSQLQVPIICVIIGEGASGGALGIGVGDRILMMENTWYSVISPESCSSILWRSWDYKELAAKQLHLTPNDMLRFGLIDEVIPEPLGGANRDPDQAALMIKEALLRHIRLLSSLPAEKRVVNRIEKYATMGAFENLED